MKVLVIRFSSMGDIVLTTPVVRVLKTQLNDAEVHFAIQDKFSVLMESNPYINKVQILGRSLQNFIKQLKGERYDYIIDLHHDLRTRIIKTALGVKAFSFNKLNLQNWLLVNLKINRLPNVHLVDRYLDTLKPLGLKADALGLDYFIPEKDNVPLDWLPPEFQKGYVAYAMDAQHNTKKLPIKRMIELCDKINKPIVLLGGKEDFEAAEVVREFFERPIQSEYESGLTELEKKTIIFNACGKFNVNQSASLIKNARYVFAHDTDSMHVAAAFKKEVFSIWGNTIPEFGMYPYRTRFTVLENKKADCRPCSKIGYAACPKGHFKCMNEIVFDFYLP
jgi:ADP-heptose:LPS heptosyltransferase